MMRQVRTFRIVRAEPFVKWLNGLRDAKTVNSIERRISRLAVGNFGDSKGVSDRVSEVRIDIGPGYRVYFTRVGNAIVVLLGGGDKSSQSRDIVAAKSLISKVEDIIRGTE